MAARRALLTAVGVGTGGAAVFLSSSRNDLRPGHTSGAPRPWDDVKASPAPRAAQLAHLRSGNFDVLVIGGGATGAGAALDAATRGLRTALVEADDFASGTSSRSTKLIHGGVRYLEKAFFQLDYGQLKLVLEALQERRHMLVSAPHLSSPLPTLTPCYAWWELPYYWLGLKAYDLVAGAAGLTWSRFVTAQSAHNLFPPLATVRSGDPAHAALKGGVVYYDGQMDDARINVALATTAALAGAAVVNHVRVERLLKDERGTVRGVACKDVLTGATFEVDAKAVINATGPFCDALRSQATGKAETPALITPSSGVHITLPAHFCGSNTGLIVPRTRDGRVCFLLPWLGASVAGTTDAPTTLTHTPRPTAKEVDFILATLGEYLDKAPGRADVLSAWSGIRPLAADPSKGSTENITRDHVLTVDNGVVTITGGKWTTYRKMAEDAVDAAVEHAKLAAQPCTTRGLPLTGAAGWNSSLTAKLIEQAAALQVSHVVDASVAAHLARAYGDRAPAVLSMAHRNGPRLLAAGWPVLDAEVTFCARTEFCSTAVDFLARRSRLAFLDVVAARQALPRVVQLLGEELHWSRARRKAELLDGNKYLDTFELG